MKKVLCGDRHPLATIEPRVAPVLLSLEPYVGEACVHVEIPENPQQGIAYSILQGMAFPKAVSFKEWSEVPEGSYLIITQEEGLYTAYFCLSHSDQVVSLKGTDDGLVLRGVSGSSRNANAARSALICIQGDDVYSTVRKTLLQALAITGGLGKSSQDKVLPRWIDRLGWVADGTKGHEEIIVQARRMIDMNYPLGFMIIGDGWQEAAVNPKTRRGSPMLYSFEANPALFPQGLKGLIEELWQLGIQYVGVWHGMMGCKGGIHPHLAKKYDLPPDREGRYFLGYDMGRTFQFYHDYYSHLREQGVTFVKVGDQGSPFSFCRPGMDVTSLYKNLQTAMQAAGSVHFHSSHFNGDCLLNPNLFYWGSSEMVEVSEDGAIRDSLQNSFWSQVVAHPDDGSWKQIDAAHAIFQSLSGSHHLIEDEHPLLGEFFQKMVLPSGTMLQPDQPLTLCADSLFIDPVREKVCYKAFTTKGECGVIAAFNLYQENATVQGRIGPKDVPSLVEDRYAVLSHQHGFIGVYGMDERFSIKLASDEADVFTFAPVHRGLAVLGFYHYYLSPGPILEVDIEEEHVHISAVIGSPILLYSEHDVFEVRRNGETIPWEYDGRCCLLTVDSRDQILDHHANYSIVFY